MLRNFSGRSSSADVTSLETMFSRTSRSGSGEDEGAARPAILR